MTESLWNGFRRIDFTFEGFAAILVFPKEETATENWLMKTEYFDAFPQLEVDMLTRGWHLAYLQNVTRWCLNEDLDRKQRFCVYLHETYGLSLKCVPVGMSCGGLIGSKFAGKHPAHVAGLYLDAPVLNLLSSPGGCGRGNTAHLMAEFTEATGMTLVDLLSYREHPIDFMPVWLSHRIPVVLIYGKEDDLVPYEENGRIVEDYYRRHGGTLLAVGKDGCGHHPHGLADNAPIVAFLLAHCSQ